VSERPCPCARGAVVGHRASGAWVCFLSEAKWLSDFVFQILGGTPLTCSYMQVSVRVVRHNDVICDLHDRLQPSRAPSFEGISQIYITLIYNWTESNRILNVHCTSHRNMSVMWHPETGHRL